MDAQLITEQRCGRGMPNRIYIVKIEMDTESVRNYVNRENLRTADSACLMVQLPNAKSDELLTTVEGIYLPDKPISDIKTCQNDTSRTDETEVQELPNQHPNKTYINKTYSNHTDSSQSVSHCASDNTYKGDGQTDDVYSLEDILENCQLDTFEEQERKILYDALERLFYSENFKIGGAVLPRRKVRSRMYEIDVTTLQSAIEKLHKNKKPIKNMTAYVMSTVFNCITEDYTLLLVDPYLNSLRQSGEE